MRTLVIILKIYATKELKKHPSYIEEELQ